MERGHCFSLYFNLQENLNTILGGTFKRFLKNYLKKKAFKSDPFGFPCNLAKLFPFRTAIQAGTLLTNSQLRKTKYTKSCSVAVRDSGEDTP